MKRFSSLLISSSLLATIAVPAFAFEFLAQEELTVSTVEPGDVYAFGGRTIIEEDVTGDLITAGGQVDVRGNVSEDIAVVGGQLRLEGNVGDDLRVAGGNISIEGNVEGDLIVVGGSVEIRSTSTIAGDVFVAGGEVRIEGNVNGKLMARSGMLTIAGTVNGEADIKAEELRLLGTIAGSSTFVAQKLTLGDDARLNSPVTYWTRDGEVEFGEVAAAGATFSEELRPYTPPTKHQQKEAGAAIAAALSAIIGFALLSAAVSILVLLLITKTYFPDAVKKLKGKYWQNALIGFLYFVVTPLFGLFLLITLIGAPLAVAVFALYFISLLFANALTAIVIAKWAEVYWKRKWNKTGLFFVAVFVYILLKVLGFIPVLGWIVKFVLVCMAFGALAQTEYEKFKKVR